MGFHSGKYTSHWLLKLDFITMFFVGGRRYGIYSSFEIKVKYEHTIGGGGRVEEHFSVNVLLTNKIIFSFRQYVPVFLFFVFFFSFFFSPVASMLLILW